MNVLRLRREGLDWREIEGEIVALVADTSTYVSANSSGALVWNALAAGATVEQLVDTLVERYDIAPERARADVEAFLETLRTRGLLESAP